MNCVKCLKWLFHDYLRRSETGILKLKVDTALQTCSSPIQNFNSKEFFVVWNRVFNNCHIKSFPMPMHGFELLFLKYRVDAARLGDNLP